MIAKRQTWLPRKICDAVKHERPHDAHIFHLKRYALSTEGKLSPDGMCQPFFSYFWCEGREVELS